MSRTVAILGASDNPERFSNRAQHALRRHGYSIILVNPTLKEIDGVKVLAHLREIKTQVDTLAMYVNPKISTELKSDILKLKPARVIFNPGTENAGLEKELVAAGIHVVQACTLVLLSAGQFEKA